MATELSDWFLHNENLGSYPICSEIQDGEPTEAEIVALLEKATPENTKK